MISESEINELRRVNSGCGGVVKKKTLGRLLAALAELQKENDMLKAKLQGRASK